MQVFLNGILILSYMLACTLCMLVYGVQTFLYETEMGSRTMHLIFLKAVEIKQIKSNVTRFGYLVLWERGKWNFDNVDPGLSEFF
jgi:hypothetical protein